MHQPLRGEREKPPSRRRSITYSMHIGRLKMFVTLASHKDARVAEVFVDVAKEGSTLRTAIHAWAIAVSKAIQYGMPLLEVVETFGLVSCPPSGAISCEDVPGIHGKKARSIWHAVTMLIQAETDEQGRLRDLLTETS